MRWLGSVQTDTSARTDPVLMQRLRVAAYSQYEYSILALMALSGHRAATASLCAQGWPIRRPSAVYS